MKKTFVLDTNVLLQSPESIFAFEDNLVIIPDIVLEELDKFKKGNSEVNFNSREVIKILDDLREKGNLIDGVEINEGGKLKIESVSSNIEDLEVFSKKIPDNKILGICSRLKDLNHDVRLVTKDLILRIKCDIEGIKSEDFECERAPKISDQYKGRREIFIDDEMIDALYKNNKIPIKDLKALDLEGNLINEPFIANEFLIMKSNINPSKCALGRVLPEKDYISKLYYDESHPYGITPRGAGQKFMQEALLSSVSVAPLVIIKGPAGTAKTFMSLACGLQKVIEDREFRRILVCRPNISMDEDLGFLPGTEREKIDPLMRPIYDNLEVLVDSDAKHRYEKEEKLEGKIEYIFNKGYIDAQAVGYLRGRSIAKHYIIIDEAQNLTPRAAKGIITRAGKDTKIILCGDPEQVDTKFLDARTNGLSYISEVMKDSPLCWQLTCDDEECIRSPLASDAIKRIRD